MRVHDKIFVVSVKECEGIQIYYWDFIYKGWRAACLKSGQNWMES